MLNDLVSKLVPGRKELIFKGFSPNSQGKQMITLYDNDVELVRMESGVIEDE